MSERITKSSGDVFRDLGFTEIESEELRLRSDLMTRVRDLIIGLGLPQEKIAKRLGVAQPRVSDLLRGKIHLFSIDMLTGMLSRLGAHVSVVVDDFYISGKPAKSAPVWKKSDCFRTMIGEGSIEEPQAVDTQLALAA